MKKLFLLLCLVPVMVFAERQTLNFQATCDNTDIIFQTIIQEYKEKPVTMSMAQDLIESTVVIWANPKTQTWTMTATMGKLTCVIGYGSKFVFVSGDML